MDSGLVVEVELVHMDAEQCVFNRVAAPGKLVS
jgi:hypothetical protein